MQEKSPLAGRNLARKLPANYIEKGEIVVLNAQPSVMTLRDEFEECGHTLALLIDLLNADLDLTQRARLALMGYGLAQLNRFERAEAMLRDYVEDTAPS